jgi:hypothetical protein
MSSSDTDQWMPQPSPAAESRWTGIVWALAIAGGVLQGLFGSAQHPSTPVRVLDGIYGLAALVLLALALAGVTTNVRQLRADGVPLVEAARRSRAAAFVAAVGVVAVLVIGASALSQAL